MRSNILVIARDTELRARLARCLQTAGHRVELADSVHHARRVGSGKPFPLAIVAPDRLGLRMPEHYNQLRAVTGKTLFLEARGSASRLRPDSIDPSDEDTLLARVAEALRPLSETAEAVQKLYFADWTFDLAGQTLADQAGREIELTRGEFSLLREFAQRPGRVLSRDHLLQSLAGRDAESYDRSIDMLVVRLRRKIERDPRRPSLITTVPGSGYKFAANVTKTKAVAAPDPRPAAAPPQTSPLLVERRQITALSAELLAGPGASLPVDPEELGAVVDAYRRRAAAIITRHGGTLARGLVREVLAYFGYPAAQEDAAERAIHTALAVVAEQPASDAELPPGPCVRAGIATSLVVADTAGEVLGDAPNEAATLRGLAGPGQVIVTATARRFAGDLFSYRDVRPVMAQGHDARPLVWQVLGPSALVSHSEALYGAALAPMVGREDELGVLLRAWQQARSGEGRLVMVSGEPGIGKSRLLAALEERLATEPHRSLRYFCAPIHQASPLHPIIARWEQEAGFAPDDSAADRLRGLESILANAEVPPEDVALFAAMLSIPTGERYPQPELSPQRRRERTIAALFTRLASLAQVRPVVILFEDVQWADPSSIEVLDRTVERLAGLPILLAVSFRPEFAAPWIGRPGAGLIVLNRLDRSESETLAAQILSERELGHALLERIIAQGDGVPLFIEELTKAVLETAAGKPGCASPPLSVPATLRDSLMARLDRLPAAKQVAQIGAVIGREFPQVLLAAVAQVPQTQLAQGLAELVASGLAFCRGAPPDAVYLFKHALVQEIAYESVLRSSRQQLHQRTAAALCELTAERVQTEPEIAAYHFTHAGMKEAAVEWWDKAGNVAFDRSAYVEATAHFARALDLVEELEDSAANRIFKLGLQMRYGHTLGMGRGFALPEATAAFARAHALATAVGDMPEAFAAQYGLWSGSFYRGDLAMLRQISTAVLRQVGSGPRGPDAAIAHRMSGMTSWFEGDFVGARAHLERAVAINERNRDRAPEFRFGLAESVPALANLARALWPIGEIDRAMRLYDEAISVATRINHVPTIAWAHHIKALFEVMRRDGVRARPHTDVLLHLAREHRMPQFLAVGTFYRGWVHWDAGDREVGKAAMIAGMARMSEQHIEVSMPMFATLLAEVHAETGDLEAGLAALDGQLATIKQTGQRWFLAEVHRARGDLLLKRASGEPGESEAAYSRAIDIARGQSAKLFELRATLGLARLWAGRGKRAEARDRLAAIYAWFTQGFDTADLRSAKALLDELAR